MFSKKLLRSLGGGILFLLLAANLYVGARLYQQEGPAQLRQEAFENIQLFTRVLEQIRLNYVDADRTSYHDLITSGLQGMLQSLDDHSQFLDPSMHEDMKDDTRGRFGGLGIVISQKDGVLTIVAPMENTPGFEAGLLSGDRIVEIDGESTEGLALPDAVKRLRGDPGTAVTIRILRPKTQEVKEMTIVRDRIRVDSVKDTEMLDGGIGYIRVTQFNDPTGDALDRAIEQLLEQDMRALVLDLRNNPGGLLSSAIDVSQRFLDRGSLIVYTLGRDERQKQVFKARGRRRYLDFPMAILVNRGSASASEIVAGALQDHNRAILVGEKTFGKGSVQSVIGMEDGSAIRLTTAKYYTPSQRVIHERGIEPDILVPMDPDEWRRLLMERNRPPNTDAEFDEEGDATGIVDIQLERAIDVLKGVMIFEASVGRELRLSSRD